MVRMNHRTHKMTSISFLPWECYITSAILDVRESWLTVCNAWFRALRLSPLSTPFPFKKGCSGASWRSGAGLSIVLPVLPGNFIFSSLLMTAEISLFSCDLFLEHHSLVPNSHCAQHIPSSWQVSPFPERTARVPHSCALSPLGLLWRVSPGKCLSLSGLCSSQHWHFPCRLLKAIWIPCYC